MYVDMYLCVCVCVRARARALECGKFDVYLKEK